MHIVWFSWKDRKHPEAGGAETVSGQIMDRLVRDGHEVTLITSLYEGSLTVDTMNGANVRRAGGRYGVYLRARRAFKDLPKNKPVDLVIDEMNTLPFASSLYTKSRKILVSYQLAREVWFYQIVFPVSLLGYTLEPIMLKLLQKLYPLTLTESRSSKVDFERYGFKDVRVFRVGMELSPIGALGRKKNTKTVLSLGAIRPMKRTLHAVKAFEYARDLDDSLRMVIAGDTSTKYAQKTLSYISNSRHAQSIEVKGRVSYSEKISLMKKSGVILVTSIKEGWGLIVTEANSQGTPAIAYDSDGLRDSVQHDITGIVCESGNYQQMGRQINKLLGNTSHYETLRQNGWDWSKQFTFENSYRDFVRQAGIE